MALTVSGVLPQLKEEQNNVNNGAISSQKSNMRLKTQIFFEGQAVNPAADGVVPNIACPARLVVRIHTTKGFVQAMGCLYHIHPPLLTLQSFPVPHAVKDSIFKHGIESGLNVEDVVNAVKRDIRQSKSLQQFLPRITRQFVVDQLRTLTCDFRQDYLATHDKVMAMLNNQGSEGF